MSYQESKSLTNMLSSILITGIYALIVYQRYLNGMVEITNVFKFWAIIILIFIPVTIIARIVIMIIFTIIHTAVQTARGEEVDNIDFVDERDKLIELKATKISLIIFTLGFILALVTQVINMSDHLFFITLAIFMVITEIASELLTIIYYRKGF
jgi:hypothetical protein